MTDRIVMIGEKKFLLPFIDLLPFNDAQNKALGEAIQRDNEVYMPVICWKEKAKSNEETVIDGAHRILWASEHGLKSVPIKRKSFDSELDAKAACYSINKDRRHLTEGELSEARQARVKIVEELVAKGESERSIAASTGISRIQVRDDKKKAGLGTPPAQKDICKRCKRLGSPVKDCKSCADVGKKKARKKARSEPSANGESDAFKNHLPTNRKNAFCDPWIQSTIDTLAQISERFRTARLIDGMEKRKGIYPFFEPKEFVDGCGFVIHYLDQLIDHLKDNRPAGVCPACSGEGCPECRSSGLVTRKLYEALKK